MVAGSFHARQPNNLKGNSGQAYIVDSGSDFPSIRFACMPPRTPDPFPPAQPIPPSLDISELGNALLRIARGDRTDLAALLHDVEVQTILDGTKVICHCHSVALDGMGRPRVSDLAAAVRERALEYAIPRSEIAAAEQHFQRTRSPARLIGLDVQARSLFTDLENSGEGGELLLFVLAETLLQLPQIICKMSLKTNTRMHVHGVDGVHAGVDPVTTRLALYWGESKIHNDAADAIRECLASLAPVLAEFGPGAAHERDLQLLQRAADLDDPDLETALKRFLNPRDPAYNDLEFRGLCLVGFDCDAYPSAVAAMRQQELIESILSQLPGWKRQIARRVGEERLNDFTVHIICVPFPSVDAFRMHMRLALGVTSAAA